MTVTPAIRNLIREAKTHQMLNVIQTSTREGMQTLNQCLAELCRRGDITPEEASARSTDTTELSELLTGPGTKK
jgi:twitching motility protein PilT